MTTHALPLTPELYAELITDLEELKADLNPWAASWLQILDTLEEEQRPPVLAALIRGLPDLYTAFRELGVVALKRIVGQALEPIATSEDYFAALTDVPVGPKPPSVPDHLGELFAPLATEEE